MSFQQDLITITHVLCYYVSIVAQSEVFSSYVRSCSAAKGGGDSDGAKWRPTWNSTVLGNSGVRVSLLLG